VLGLYIFCFISFAGFDVFELGMVLLSVTGARSAYRFSFHGKARTVDIAGYVVMVVISAMVLVTFLGAVRLLLTLDIDSSSRCMLFSGSITLVVCLTYSYITLACSEDERKHQLCPCKPEGLEVGCHKEERQEQDWKNYSRFLEWIISWRWWMDLQDWGLATEEDCKSGDTITVHNHTLKLIKVCFYSPEDLFCWVPYGGVSGRCVGLISAGNCRSFYLPRKDDTQEDEQFKLKIFQPGLLDKELACFHKASRGRSFAFLDVEGMVRHSRLLSSTRSPLESSLTIPESSEDESSHTTTPRTTTNSDGKPSSPVRPLTPPQAAGASQSELDLLRLGGRGGGLARRHSSSDNLQQLALEVPRVGDELSADSSPSQAQKEGRLEVRRAGPDEVVVRNRSNQEISARLFRSDDYCYFVPLIGKFTACGDCILPDSERRFNPAKIADRDFTLKVYSIGAGARELTYLTVSRGHTYTFCDSLLS
jgi:hypothetical protein